jgi:superfamily I DNA/RNA helicase
VKELLRYLREKAREGYNLEEVLQEVSLLQEDEEKGQGVRLMTIHASKGLEFSVVFIPRLEEGILPHEKSLEDQRELEEERRLFYVAITRAKDLLYMSYVKEIAPKLMIGYSAHSLESALYAQEQGADFITLSPIFETSSHPEAKPLGLFYLQEVAKKVSIPIYALGGITWDRIKLCYKNGAYGVAGISLFIPSQEK